MWLQNRIGGLLNGFKNINSTLQLLRILVLPVLNLTSFPLMILALGSFILYIGRTQNNFLLARNKDRKKKENANNKAYGVMYLYIDLMNFVFNI